MIYYYLIKPNTELQALLAQHPYISLPPELLEIEEVGRPMLGFLDGIEIRKLFYLAKLHEYMQLLLYSEILSGRWTDEERRQKYKFFHDLLGDPPYKRRLFDRWWTLERIDIVLNYKDAFKRLSVSSLEALEETESEGVAAWLETRIEWKTEALNKGKPK